MVKSLLLFFIVFFCTGIVQGQSLTVDDLVALSSLSGKNTDNFLNKNGFVSAGKSLQYNLEGSTYIENNKLKSKDTTGTVRTVSLYQKSNIDYYVLHTTSQAEYREGTERLKKAGFITDSIKNKKEPFFYQKKNITVIADFSSKDGYPDYTFTLQKKNPPSAANIKFAEDLLMFDSHEFLVSYFGTKNVSQDVYYFSEKELKKCSVLYPNTSRQVTFIWDDDATLTGLSYILISGILPTESVMQFSASVSQNRWETKNGIFSNMTIKELMDLNEYDFEFFGRNSEFSYMASPNSKGRVDFKKTGITFGCFNCNNSDLMTNEVIKASDAIKAGLTLYVVYVMIRP